MTDDRDIQVAKELAGLTQAVKGLEAQIVNLSNDHEKCRGALWCKIGDIEEDIKDHDRHITKIWSIGGVAVFIIMALDVGVSLWKALKG